MPLPDVFVTNFASRLASAIGATDDTLTLASVPSNLPAGTYRFRLGTSQRTSEWLAAIYPGAGTTFTNARRGEEGGNPALAWPAGTAVAHVLTGEAFESLRSIVTTPFSPATHPELYVRPPALRAFIAANFT